MGRQGICKMSLYFSQKIGSKNGRLTGLGGPEKSKKSSEKYHYNRKCASFIPDFLIFIFFLEKYHYNRKSGSLIADFHIFTFSRPKT